MYKYVFLAFAALLCASCAAEKVIQRRPGPGGVTVQAVWPGKSAAEVAKLVAGPLEAELAKIKGVSLIITRCDGEGCSIVLEHDRAVSADAIAFEASSIAKRLQPSTPDGARVAVFPCNMNQAPDLVIALVMDAAEVTPEHYDAAQDFARSLMRLPATAWYELPGAPLQQTVVEVDRARAAAAGVAAAEVAKAIERKVIDVDEYRRVIVRESGARDDVGDIVLQTDGDVDVRVKDVATVRKVMTPANVYHVNGEPAIIVRVFLHSGASPEEAEACLERVLRLPPPSPVKRVLLIGGR